MRCQICKAEEVTWSWQPLGPDQDVKKAFVLPGSHHRAFPVVKVGDACKKSIQAGVETTYTYKHQQYTANKAPRPAFYPVDPHTDLWHGGTGVWNSDGTGECTLICRDIEGVPGESHDIVALVVDPMLAQLFLTAPQLLACAEVLRTIYDDQRIALGPHEEVVAKALGNLNWAREVNATKKPGEE